MSSNAPTKPPAGPAASGAPAPATGAPKPASGTTTAKPKKTKAKATKAAGAGAGTQAKAKRPARKKKTTSKAVSAASTQAIWNDAKAAQIDLAKQRAQAAARRSDPLWYRVEDILPFIADTSSMVPNTGILPEQVHVTETALARNGMTRADVTPQAMACLLEQARRFAQELITDAQDYCYSAARQDLTRSDLLLAAEMRADHPMAVTAQLPKLNLVAQQVNRAPLPPIPMQCYSGVLLPPAKHQLTCRTYDIVSSAQVAQKMVQAASQPPRRKESPVVSLHPGYGASKGRQIPIKLKEQPKAEAEAVPVPMDTSGSSSPAKPAAAAASGAAPSLGAPGTKPVVPATTAALAHTTTTTPTMASSVPATIPGGTPAPTPAPGGPTGRAPPAVAPPSGLPAPTSGPPAAPK